MNKVVDAQIVKAYYEEDVLGITPSTTASATKVFDELSIESPIFVDDGGMILHEWENVVCREWFHTWYPTLLMNGLVEIQVHTHQQLRNELNRSGFPSKGRDIWYVRTAKEVLDCNGDVTLITEDLDFYEPSQKGCPHTTRLKILLNSRGSICKVLSREDIIVKCLATYNSIDTD